MSKITNTSKGVIGVNAKIDGKVKQVSLAPGETKDDLDVIETKVFKGRVESGALTLGKAAAKPQETEAEKAKG